MTHTTSVNLKTYFAEKEHTHSTSDITGYEAYNHPTIDNTGKTITFPISTAGLYKIKVDDKGHVIDVATVTASDLPTHSHSEYTVTVEKQSTAESGNISTYVVKQNGTQVGSKINIPKDFLVKSASVKTSAANNSPEAGFSAGDKYIEFVINTKENDGTDEKMYVNVKDLVDTYTADETTLTLSNNQFSIKSGVIPAGEDTDSNILMDGTADAGSSTKFARADHVHPTDTSRIATSAIKYDLVSTSGGTTSAVSYTKNGDVLGAASGQKLQQEIMDLDAFTQSIYLDYDDTTGILSIGHGNSTITYSNPSSS